MKWLVTVSGVLIMMLGYMVHNNYIFLAGSVIFVIALWFMEDPKKKLIKDLNRIIDEYGNDNRK